MDFKTYLVLSVLITVSCQQTSAAQTPNWESTTNWGTSTILETTTEPYDPNVLPDLDHVERYINDTIEKLDRIRDNEDLIDLANVLKHLTDNSDVDIESIIELGYKQLDVLKVISSNVNENFQFCFDVVADMTTKENYNKTFEECIEDIPINGTAIIEEFDIVYKTLLNDLNLLKANYENCQINEICQAQYVLKLYDSMFTLPLKLDIALEASKVQLNQSIIGIKTCSVDVANYYTSIFDVVRQCIGNLEQ